ncbi:MAG TPA: peptide chain release factor N(5)-glutamine methyltransferase [Vicinamibacterales bacterium]|jgi:release factor glutamine methyltransferase
MTLNELVLTARKRLTDADIGLDQAAMDASLLAREVLGWDLAKFLAHQTDTAPAGFADRFDTLVARRAAREPISEIIGRREFWGLDFEVGRDVLTPRPETEFIVEEAIACLAEGPAGHTSGAATAVRAGEGVTIVDVGTGCGCLAVCLAREFPAARIVATDISAAALAVAVRNARRHGVADRIQFHQASLLDGVDGPVSLIVSNPPYVPGRFIGGLPPEVRDHEPHVALDGGSDGLQLIAAIVDTAPPRLMPRGWLVMEFGYGQDDDVRRIVGPSQLELVRIRDDLQGIPRTAVCRRL